MQEAFEKIKQRIRINATEACGYAPMIRVVSEAEIKEIIKQVAAEYNNGWIPCSERLPEENMEVIVTISEMDGYNHTSTSWMQDGVWIIKKTPLQPTVIAWQPIPEPYQSKGE